MGSNKTPFKKPTLKIRCELENVLKVKRITFHHLTEYFADKRVFQRDQKEQKDTNSMFAAMVTRYVS